jgi:hypothetical protein
VVGVGDVTVHLVWSWHCLDCPECGDAGLTNQAADLAARKHTDATRHPTVTSGKPERPSPTVKP